MLAMINPQTSNKLVGGYGTSLDHLLAMAFDDLCRVLNAHEIVLGGYWLDIW